MHTRLASALLVLPVSALLLAGCATGASSSDSSDADGVQVVASTNVYGNLAATVGGELVQVTSIIDDPEKDPHEYEADARNQLALAKADLVIENGGGYDDFMDTLLDSADNGDVTVLNVADISGYEQEPAEGEFNEHLWYDFPTVSKLVDEIVADLAKTDPENADTYTSNGDALKTELTDLESQEAALKSAHAGEGVAITEPVPLYLLDASGLTNRTPDEFSEAIEEDTDVPADVLQETLDLFATKSVALLAYNAQTVGPQTEQVLAAAKQNGIPVVPVTETLPSGRSYIEWMQDNLTAVSDALNG